MLFRSSRSYTDFNGRHKTHVSFAGLSDAHTYMALQLEPMFISFSMRCEVACPACALNVVCCERARLSAEAAENWSTIAFGEEGEDGNPVVHRMHGTGDEERGADKVAEDGGGLVEPEAPDRRGGAVHEAERGKEH